jgi:hypothetical protein
MHAYCHLCIFSVALAIHSVIAAFVLARFDIIMALLHPP